MEKKPLNYKKMSDMVSGDSGKIILLEGNSKIRRVMENMGFTPGARVSFRRSAPLGDPLEFNVRGYEIAIRKKDAEMITVHLD